MTEDARALGARLSRLRPFAFQIPMVNAAAPSMAASAAIERYLATGRSALRTEVESFLRWADGPAGAAASGRELQRRFSLLRLRFLGITTQVDIFDDVLAQRSQHGLGERLAGLDEAAMDALRIPGGYYTPPPLLCYLERGHGAAIRRARTRLPGGGENPVAVIQIPRERMIGSGIASSLVHEVGHQAAALLDLVAPLRETLAARRAQQQNALAWGCFERWISEIVADVWSVARLGPTATIGLTSVLSLPRAFVFRVTLDDPHPAPWIRVKISAAFGRRLFPDPVWSRIESNWEQLYPLDGLDAQRREIFRRLTVALPELVETVLRHRPKALAGAALVDVLPRQDRTPRRLRQLAGAFAPGSTSLSTLSPTVALAALGLAKFEGRIGGAYEARSVGQALRFWALRALTDASEACAHLHQVRPSAFVA